MKNLTVAVCMLAAGLATAAEPWGEDQEFVLRGRYVSPKTDEDWKSGGGAEAQFRFWSDAGLGLGLSLGFDSWKARSEYTEEQSDAGFFATTVDGDADVIPVGLSAFYRVPISAEAALSLEGGLRYALIDSAVHASVTVDNAGEASYFRDLVDIDNALLGVLGVELAIRLGDTVSFLAGFAYQTDLDKPQETFLGEPAGETSLEAVTVHAGLAWRF